MPSRQKPRASGTIRRWAQVWNWSARAWAWDRENERVKRLIHHATIQDMSERLAKECMMVQKKAVDRLRTMNPEELKPADAMRWLIRAIKLERLVRGEPVAESVNVSKHHGTPTSVEGSSNANLAATNGGAEDNLAAPLDSHGSHSNGSRDQSR
jgi:hypothetical protein